MATDEMELVEETYSFNKYLLNIINRYTYLLTTYL